jgi:ABC-type nitrate/sulfonate/bicarbonate transport system substrate-binding protein
MINKHRNSPRATRMSRVLIATLASAAGLALLAGCSTASSAPTASAKSSSASGTCTAPSTVTIAENTIPISLSLNMAQGLGYFDKVDAKCHTQINFDVIQSPAAQVPALLANQVQFIAVGTGNILSAATQGQQFKVLLSTAQGGGGVLIANAKDKSNGTGVNALKKYGAGSTWAVGSLGGPGQLVSDALLSSVGVDYKKVTFVPVGTDGLTAAVAGGKAAIGYASSSQAGAGAQSGQTYSVMYTASDAVYKQLGFFSEAAFATTPAFAKQYPELTQQIVNAEVLGLKATRDYFNKGTAALKLMPASYQATADANVWDDTWQQTAFTAAPLTGLTEQKDLQNEVNLSIKYGILPVGSKLPAGLADTSFVKKAYKQLGMPVPTGPIITSFMKNSPK